MTQAKRLEAALYIVATPIGNLDDLSVRAAQVLTQADQIYCEDTRHSRRLMEHIGSRVPLASLHEHNEEQRVNAIFDQLAAGKAIALVSDAGTPLISDPGFVLVRALAERGAKIVPVPGPSAVIAALSIAGLPTDRWFFEGFLPAKSSARLKRLEQLADNPHTVLFYESSHRIADTLQDLAKAMGEQRAIVLARELTKTFETVLRGSIADVQAAVANDSNQQKGEFVVLVAGAPEQETDMADPKVGALLASLKPLLPPKKAAAVAAEVFGGNKKAYYQQLLAMDN